MLISTYIYTCWDYEAALHSPGFLCTPPSRGVALSACPVIKNGGVATMGWELQTLKKSLIDVFQFF